MEDLMVVEPVPYPREKNLTTKNTFYFAREQFLSVENVGL